MNIDTLRTENGFRDALVIDIERCLNAGHITHLQTALGTVAIRPGAQLIDGERVEGFTIDHTPNGVRGRSKFFAAEERTRIIRNVLRFLNGTENGWNANEDIDAVINQGRRDGYVLAVIGNQIIAEFTFPGTVSGRETTCLRIYDVLGTRLLNWRSVSYNNVPKKWIEAIRNQAGGWEGLGQRAAGPIPFPAVDNEGAA